MTLLRQIQDELASSNVDVEAVLRKCKILARRLHSEQFAQWVDWELNGYPEGVEVPEYRTVHPQHYANFSNGYWSIKEQPISALVIDKEYRRVFEPFPFRQGIEAIKTLAQGDGGGRVDRSDYRFLLTGKVVDLPCVGFWSRVSSVELKQILSSVTSRLLDFVMDIEAENPQAGEAPPSEVPVAPERVLQLIENHFHAAVGNMAQNSSGFVQMAPLDLAQLRDLLTTVRSQLAAESLDKPTKANADAQLATIDAQLSAPVPNEGIVREAGRSLRTILEGAVAGAIVQPGAWKLIFETMNAIFGPG